MSITDRWDFNQRDPVTWRTLLPWLGNQGVALILAILNGVNPADATAFDVVGELDELGSLL
jgi:hypothetical protein